MTKSQEVFGSLGTTGKKLNIIKMYLEMYQNSVGTLDWVKTHYVDAFAGTGEIITTKPKNIKESQLFDLENYEEAKTVIKGSTKIALSIEPNFDTYTFIELNKKKINELEENLLNHKHINRINFRRGDANSEVISFCKKLGSKDRAVVFLDPFGNQVKWETVEAIAKTGKIDLWYLFPSGGGIYRQISKNGRVHFTHEAAITRILGTEDWKNEFIKLHKDRDLFDDFKLTTEKTVDPQSAADFMIKRMKTVFKGTVGDFSIPLGKHAYPSFHLLFASGNPSPPAIKLAKTLSKAAIKASDNNYGRTN